MLRKMALCHFRFCLQLLAVGWLSIYVGLLYAAVPLFFPITWGVTRLLGLPIMNPNDSANLSWQIMIVHAAIALTVSHMIVFQKHYKRLRPAFLQTFCGQV